MDRAAMPRAFSDHGNWFSAALSSAAEQFPETASAAPTLLYVYNNAIHGFSARLSSSQLSHIEKLRGFLSAYPDMPVQVDTTHSFEFLRLNPSFDPHDGEGDIVGVVDSGVWPERGSFKDDGMPEVPSWWRGTCEEGVDFNSSACNKKLIGARYFNKGLLAAGANPAAVASSDRDTEGHGTHTLSTAAGNYVDSASSFGYARGTAAWNDGTTATDLIAAIDGAISDGMDVISLSLSVGPVPLHRDPVAISAFAAMEKGIFVAAPAAVNSGPSPATLHNGAPWLFTVGAGDLDREFAGTVELGDGRSIIGTSPYVGQRPWTNHLSFGRKIVVCQTPSFASTGIAISFTAAAEVSGGIFISPTSYNLFFQRLEHPGALVSPADGAAIMEYIEKSPSPTAGARFGQTILGISGAPSVPFYTSRGPPRSCASVLKPDLTPSSTVGGVGSRVVYSPFNIATGTSISCPHAAGIAALLKVTHPQWSPAAIRSAMMTTADSLDNTGEPIRDMGEGEAAAPLSMGSGHVNPDRALNPGLVYDAGAGDYINLLCAMNLTREQITVITRSSRDDCSTPSLDLNYPSFIVYFSPNETLTNVADGSWSYFSRSTPMEGINLHVEPHTLVFKEKNEKQTSPSGWRSTLRLSRGSGLTPSVST
ncbi:unnamed protein product [Spirodela intermedia]|uniref:Uncharacterized protein n=1 Tax=Spirodela intermedia TaxID=51605 RepID=A0A7I8IUD5_SPIIN|nr:unnamed protein product [Spirodela intermedia]CAA6660577.1 unnamed protein product [Spirodela intermedia]